MKLIIKGKDRYIKHLAAHLKKEHPSTRRRLKVVGMKKQKRR